MNPQPLFETPHTVALSTSEVHALVKWHCNQTRRITNQVGKLVVTKFSPRDARAVIMEGEKMVKAHLDRARGLQSFLRK